MPKAKTKSKEPADVVVADHRPMGRPSTYDPDYVRQAREVCKRCGAVNEDLAAFFNVSLVTIHNWTLRYPEFMNAIKEGKEHWNGRVELSLSRKALGYSYTAEKIFCSKDGEVTRVEYTEHVPPSDVAICFFLKNRDPDRWKDRQVLEGNPDAPIVVRGGLPVKPAASKKGA